MRNALKHSAFCDIKITNKTSNKQHFLHFDLKAYLMAKSLCSYFLSLYN